MYRYPVATGNGEILELGFTPASKVWPKEKVLQINFSELCLPNWPFPFDLTNTIYLLFLISHMKFLRHALRQSYDSDVSCYTTGAPPLSTSLNIFNCFTSESLLDKFIRPSQVSLGFGCPDCSWTLPLSGWKENTGFLPTQNHSWCETNSYGSIGVSQRHHLQPEQLQVCALN